MALIQQLEATTLNMLISKAHSIIYTSTPVDKDQLLEFDMKDNTFSVLLIGKCFSITVVIIWEIIRMIDNTIIIQVQHPSVQPAL